MAPVISVLKQDNRFSVKVCVTGQHREMLDQVLRLFSIVPDFDLNIMKAGQDLSDITARILLELRGILKSDRFDLVLVHGDTTTTMAAAMAAFYERIAVGHVEAGLRTGNIFAPWPEEMNRMVVGRIAQLHFAPTEKARSSLLAENVSADDITVTGNTVIDALQSVEATLRDDSSLQSVMSDRFQMIDRSKRMVLVTGHRRENFGQGFEDLCDALVEVAQHEDVEIVYPVHLNPSVQEPVNRKLGSIQGIHLIEPQDYLPFVWLM